MITHSLLLLHAPPLPYSPHLWNLSLCRLSFPTAGLPLPSTPTTNHHRPQPPHQAHILFLLHQPIFKCNISLPLVIATRQKRANNNNNAILEMGLPLLVHPLSSTFAAPPPLVSMHPRRWANVDLLGENTVLLGQDSLISQEARKFAMCLIPALFAYATLHAQIRYLLMQSLISPVS